MSDDPRVEAVAQVVSNETSWSVAHDYRIALKALAAADAVDPVRQEVERLREALGEVLKSRDTDLFAHKPVDSEGAIVCQSCGDWWKECPVAKARAALGLSEGGTWRGQS